jgi:hypothetical protein
MSLQAVTPSRSERARRGRAAVAVAIGMAVAALLAGCAGTTPGSSSAPAGSGDSIVAPAAPTTPTAPTGDSSSNYGVDPGGPVTVTSPGGLSPEDMNEICAGGATCDPSSSGPPYVDGGGLALSDGGD